MIREFMKIALALNSYHNKAVAGHLRIVNVSSDSLFDFIESALFQKL